jgi:hypothetical protein
MHAITGLTKVGMGVHKGGMGHFWGKEDPGPPPPSGMQLEPEAALEGMP